MSFTVRRVEDPTIYVRKNIKPDILGISSAWDNIVDIKQSLSRVESNVAAAKKRSKSGKNTHSSDGKILKEISSETQQLGKVTRFQLPKPLQSDYNLSKNEARKARHEWSKDISSIPKNGYSSLNQKKDDYSPSRYAPKTGTTIHRERPTYFETTVIHPTVLNDPHPILNNPHPILNDPHPSKDSSFANTSGNSLSSQQFSVTSSPSFHGKTVLARNEAALQKIKEKVRKQKEMLSKTEESNENNLEERKLHDSKDHVATTGEPREKTDSKVNPTVPLKRKIGTISAVGPTYKGFNAVSEPKKQKKVEKQKQSIQTNISKDTRDKVVTKPHRKQEKKATKSKMTRITGSKRPHEVITTTSWRDGQANVKRILNAKKTRTDKQTRKADKAQIKSDNKATERTEKGSPKNDKRTTHTTYDDGSHDELSEGRLSSDDEDVFERFNAKIERFEAEKDAPEDETVKPSDNITLDSDDEKDSKMREVLSKETRSMLNDLAQDSSDSDSEVEKHAKDERAKCSSPKKKVSKNKKPVSIQKPVEDVFPKGKTRHYDQAEVQKYMAQQLAERKKKQKQEKEQKKKQKEEKQQRLKELYERQKKSFAPTKKDKRLGKTFSLGNFDVHVPSEGFHSENNQGSTKDDEIVQSTTDNESDKENTDIDEMSSECYTDDADFTLTEDILTSSRETSRRRIPVEPVVSPAPALDQRAKRLTALQATALALQSRLQSHALRLSGAKEGAVPQPAATAQTMETEFGFQGVLPGVANIRKQADENEKQSTRVAAATKIQAAYRGHTVRKRHHWKDGKSTSKRSGRTTLTSDHNDEDTIKVNSLPSAFHGTKMDEEASMSEASSDDMQFTNIRPFYETERLNNDLQHAAPKEQRKFEYDDFRTRSNFLRNDFSAPPVIHFTAPPARYEPKGDRFSVMNIFSRRYPSLQLEDILNEEPGSETASLMEVDRRKSPDQNMEYEDDFTDAEMSSVMTDGDVKRDASKDETYSECFETDEETERSKEKSKGSHSSLKRKRKEERTSQAESEERQLSERDERSKSSPQDDNMSNQHDDFILPVMASTMQPETRRSPSISPLEENEPIRRRPYIPVDRSGGNRLSPDSLQRKLTAEINLLENVEDSVRQVNDIERTRAVSLAQQETVSLAQILKAKQQTHEQEMRNLRLKAKEEAIQAAKDLEKTRQAAAMAAASAAERLAEVQTEAIKTNTEHSRKYMGEATRMTSDLLANTSNHLAEFCKNLTSTTSATIEDLHKIKRPTMTLVERGTSISEGHAINSEHSSTSDDRARTSDEGTRTSDVISNQSKSLKSSPSVRQQAGYSSDEFESYQSQTTRHDAPDIKAEIRDRPSLSPESIAEDIPEKSVSEEDTTVHEDDTTVHEDDTTVHEESGNEARDALPRESRSKGHDSVSSVLDYSSQFDDSSHALTDEDIDFNFLLPSREHRRKSMRRMKDISFDEEKRKEKSIRAPFESEDSFGKFTAEMIQQYIHEEEVRTKHQAAILRLREKSLKEKTKAEFQWLEQMKKQSRDKGSDDVMPSIKKRERGIRMKLKAEKEEIKCLRAANRAASFQRRFMIYQQQEIQKLHEATLNIRERIQKDTSKKGSERSSRERSENQPRASSPVAIPNSQSTPSSSSKSKPNQSASAKSVSEDISGEQGSSHVSPNTTGSSFPSYATPKSEDDKREPPRSTARGEQQPETSTILNMLSTVNVVGQGSSTQSGDLLKIHKMLLERQEKLVKDESEVNSALQKVAEMLKNQRNLSNQSGNVSKSSIAEASQSESRVSDASHSKASGKSPSEEDVPEEIPSTAKSVSEVKTESAADKTANDYDNATFESDDSTPRSRRSVTSHHLTSQNGEVNVEEFSLTETSDHSDVEERVRKLNEVLVREKKKFEALERKKRKIKRSVMKKEAIKLEIEIKNTRDNIHRNLAEIESASAAVQSATKSNQILSHQDMVFSPREDRGKSSEKSNASLLSDKHVESEGGNDRGEWSSTHEVEESLIEVLDDSPKSMDVPSETKRPRLLETSLVQTRSATLDIPDELQANEKEESIITDHISTPRERKGVDRGVSPENERSDQQSTSEPGSPAKDDSSDIPEEISEHSRSTASIPEQVPSVGEEETSKHSEIPEELSEKIYTPIPSDASVSEDSRIVEDTHSKAISSPEKSPESAKHTSAKTPSYSYGDDTFENSYTEPKSSAGVSTKAPSIQKISEDLPDEKSEHRTGPVEEIPSISEHLTQPVGERVSDEASYTEPESDTSVSNQSSVSRRTPEESEANKSITSEARKRSDASNISKNLFSDDEISQKSMASSRRSTEDEKSESDRQETKPSPTVPATKSNEEKSSASEQKEASESVKTRSKASPRSPDGNATRSEASSIAEEIASSYEEGDISESEGVLKESEELIFGDDVKHEKMRVDESGLDGLNGLDETGLDKPRLKELDRTQLDNIATNKSNELKENENEFVESGLKEPEMDESRIQGSDDYTPVSRESPVDVSPVKQNDESSKSQSSRDVGRNEQPKEDNYSDDFDDASIAEEISEIGEFSEIAEDSDKGENFARVEDGTPSTQGTVYESREHKSEPHAEHVGDDITNYIFKNIVVDSLTSMKNLNASKLQSVGKTTSDQGNLEQKKRVDNEGPLDTHEVISEHVDTPDVSTERLDRARLDTRREAGSQTVTEMSEEGHAATNGITKDLLADAIMQMIEIQKRKKKNIKLPAAVEAKPSEPKNSRTALEVFPPTGGKLPEKISEVAIPTGTTSPVSIPEIKSPADDETAIDNALKIAKTNQILDDDALRSIDEDIAGLLGTVDDDDEFPVNITNFTSDIPSDNETSFPEYAPMFAVPHSIQELTPMVNSTIDVLLEQRRMGRPLKDCVPQAQFLAGETEIECVSTQSYRHLVFDLTKEVFIDTVSQNEPAARTPWTKAKWKGGQKLSRHFKRWKSDEEIRAAVMERVTNLIGLGAPRATMATIPRKTPVRGNKKDNVDAILIEELRQEEPLWTDYEEDETNVKFQVADAILNMMLEDTVRVFNAIQAKKHVPDNVLVV